MQNKENASHFGVLVILMMLFMRILHKSFSWLTLPVSMILQFVYRNYANEIQSWFSDVKSYFATMTKDGYFAWER